MVQTLLTIAIVAGAMVLLAIGVIVKGKCYLGGCGAHGSSSCACKDKEESDADAS